MDVAGDSGPERGANCFEIRGSSCMGLLASGEALMNHCKVSGQEFFLYFLLCFNSHVLYK